MRPVGSVPAPPGSSPHTWGIPYIRPFGCSHPRFIPTYVGYTTNRLITIKSPPVHPHIRGIYGHGPGEGQCPIRFIPTYVGYTFVTSATAPANPVHPHIRGVYSKPCCAPTQQGGSSPHTWGIPKKVKPENKLSRFIPTYVGHTASKTDFDILTSVHPHIRGAYGLFDGFQRGHYGSSPHTWGIHWTAVRKMAGFSHFSYDFIRKSYFVQGLVFFGVIGAEASPTHRRGRSQCLPGAHGGSVRNL